MLMNMMLISLLSNSNGKGLMSSWPSSSIGFQLYIAVHGGLIIIQLSLSSVTFSFLIKKRLVGKAQILIFVFLGKSKEIHVMV